MFRVKASAPYGPSFDRIFRLFHQLSPSQATARMDHIIWIGSGPETTRTWFGEVHVAACEGAMRGRRERRVVKIVEECILLDLCGKLERREGWMNDEW